jgi:hypothetical protein
MLLKFGNQFCGRRDLALFPALGIEPELRLGGYAHGVQLEIDVAPEEIHHFLLAEAGQQKSREQRALRIVAGPNWQSYSGESTLSYLVQMVGLTMHNFTSGAAGMAVAVAKG